MITETIYHPSDLHRGECERCGEMSDELIYTEDGQEICIDCYEDEKFYQETMKGL
jgi:formylmethanofuran dehydrogenase subunit E